MLHRFPPPWATQSPRLTALVEHCGCEQRFPPPKESQTPSPPSRTVSNTKSACFSTLGAVWEATSLATPVLDAILAAAHGTLGTVGCFASLATTVSNTMPPADCRLCASLRLAHLISSMGSTESLALSHLGAASSSTELSTVCSAVLATFRFSRAGDVRACCRHFKSQTKRCGDVMTYGWVPSCNAVQSIRSLQHSVYTDSVGEYNCCMRAKAYLCRWTVA